MARIFRTRSPDRDNTSDGVRSLAVRGSLEQALRDTQLELDGLERRIETALIASVTLMDNSGEYGERAAADEQDITEYELQAERGRLRVIALRRQAERYARMLAILSDNK